MGMVQGSVRQAGVCLVVTGTLFATACTTITRNSKTGQSSNPTQSGWVPDTSSPPSAVKSEDLKPEGSTGTAATSAPVAAPANAGAVPPTDPGKPPEVTALLQTLNSRLDSMESKIGSLNDRVEVIAFQKEVESRAKVKKTPIPPAAAVETVGEPATVSLGDDDPQAGFIQDVAVIAFREGAVALAASRYDEAIIKFSSIVEKYAEHALAGSAQYYVGESYFRKGEMKLAVQEFERVLNAYDRSPHVSETLQRLVQIHQAQGMKVESDRARQLLTSLFPQSPAAGAVDTPAPDQQIKRADDQLQRAESEIQRVEQRLKAIDGTTPTPAATETRAQKAAKKAADRADQIAEKEAQKKAEKKSAELETPPAAASAAEKDPAKEIAKELAKEGLKDAPAKTDGVEPPPEVEKASSGPDSKMISQPRPMIRPASPSGSDLEPPPTAPGPAPGAG